MSRNIRINSTAAALAIFALAAAFPQGAFADNSAGVWQIDPSRSTMSDASKTGSLTVDRKAYAPATAAAAGQLMVIANGNVYLATGDAAKDALAGKPVDPSRMVQIGTNVHSHDICGFQCQGGRPETHRTLAFTTLGGEEKFLAYGGK
jgi:hypothetical protein